MLAMQTQTARLPQADYTLPPTPCMLNVQPLADYVSCFVMLVFSRFVNSL